MLSIEHTTKHHNTIIVTQRQNRLAIIPKPFHFYQSMPPRQIDFLSDGPSYKVVRFADGPYETHIVDRKTPEDILRTCYSRQDYAFFHQECRDIIQSARENTLDYNSFCIRGLERFIHYSGSETRKVAIRFVLDEQESQRKQGIHDPAQLMLASMVISKNSKAIAKQLAAVDEIAARASEECLYNVPLSNEEEDDDDWLHPESLGLSCTTLISETQGVLPQYSFTLQSSCGAASEPHGQLRPRWLDIDD